MDIEDLRYHELTRRIDDSMEIIEKIVRELTDGDCKETVRPKMVLERLAQELG